MSERLTIEGGRPLRGIYRVQGNKNAALPLVAASVLSPGPLTLRNVPNIIDINNLVSLLEGLNVRTEWQGRNLLIDPGQLKTSQLPTDIVHRLRGAILLLGAVAPKMDSLVCALPGGCPIGRRSFEVHWSAFRACGFRVEQDPEKVILKRDRVVKNPSIFLEEASVTATENALILMAGLGGGEIENPAREPHVLSLIEFLRDLGCHIEIDSLSVRVLSKVTNAPATDFEVPGDYVDAGTLAIAATVTNGEIELTGIDGKTMLGVAPVLRKFGISMHPLADMKWSVRANQAENPDRVIAGPWPAFPTDLVSLAIVLATQGHGQCLIHDWMYEARMFFVDKLARMGASVTLCDPHRVMISGPKNLRGITLESPDIRAGMAMVVAGLCAEGTTVIEHAEVIRRGYEHVTKRLSRLGAQISTDMPTGM